jgi:hypothetical protein
VIRVHSFPRLTLLMRGGTLVGRKIFHNCPLAVGRAVGCRGAAGAFNGSSQGVPWGHSIRRWWCAWAMNHILIGWRFEGAEEAKVK